MATRIEIPEDTKADEVDEDSWKKSPKPKAEIRTESKYFKVIEKRRQVEKLREREEEKEEKGTGLSTDFDLTWVRELVVIFITAWFLQRFLFPEGLLGFSSFTVLLFLTVGGFYGWFSYQHL